MPLKTLNVQTFDRKVFILSQIYTLYPCFATFFRCCIHLEWLLTTVLLVWRCEFELSSLINKKHSCKVLCATDGSTLLKMKISIILKLDIWWKLTTPSLDRSEPVRNNVLMGFSLFFIWNRRGSGPINNENICWAVFPHWRFIQGEVMLMLMLIFFSVMQVRITLMEYLMFF